MISKETARAAIDASMLKRDPFGHNSPYASLSPTDKLLVRNWFQSFAVGVANLNSIVYAVANDKLYMLTKEYQDKEYIKSNNEKIDKLEKKINDGMSLEQATRALLANVDFAIEIFKAIEETQLLNHGGLAGKAIEVSNHLSANAALVREKL